jgi:hypothetical protein
LEEVGVEAEEVGESALAGGEGTQPCEHRRLKFVVFILVEVVLVAFPGSVGREPG